MHRATPGKYPPDLSPETPQALHSNIFDFRAGDGCWQVLDVNKDFVIASYSSPACQPKLVSIHD